MATARQRFERSLLVDQRTLIGSLFDESCKLDLAEYVQRGDMGLSRKAPMPDMPEVDKKVQEILANGGKLKVD